MTSNYQNRTSSNKPHYQKNADSKTNHERYKRWLFIGYVEADEEHQPEGFTEDEARELLEKFAFQNPPEVVEECRFVPDPAYRVIQ